MKGSNDSGMNQRTTSLKDMKENGKAWMVHHMRNGGENLKVEIHELDL